MNFIAFPVGATNIFPLANSSAGGQLLTEWNLRSRESVDTDSSVKYFIGKSFVHSPDDFSVYSQRDGYDTTISNTTIQIQPGRAVINGHFVELLAPINIDLNDVNYLANKENITSLKGDLAVGLRMAYSTYQTLAGSALIENADDYYDGVQVVVVPKTAVKLPKDVPNSNDFSKINMHLLLATLSYRNGVITNIKQNSEKIRSVDAERISNIDDIISGTYVSKANLDPNKLYTFAGKSANGTTIDGRDTWCDSTDSLMIWDKSPHIATTRPSTESYFTYNRLTDSTSLVVAHKQVDGMKNTGGQTVYYQDHSIELPSASFDNSTGGVVNASYTAKIKSIRDKLDNMNWLPGRSMIKYIDVLTSTGDLPEISYNGDTPNWAVGDYVLVGQDETVDASNTGRPPATMYILQPGYIQSVSGVISMDPFIVNTNDPAAIQAAMGKAPSNLKGIIIAQAEAEDPADISISSHWENIQSYRGRPNMDYFVVRYKETIDDTRERWYCYYYTPTVVSPKVEYSLPVWLTGGVPFATDTVTGGFLNVSADSYGDGYVRLDDEGHLKVVDYELLLTGVLAYQLGQDRSEGSGLSLNNIQSALEEYVNNRICFPNSDQTKNATAKGVDPSIINLYLELPEEGGQLTIHDIGSRYNSSLCVHISGKATSATTITFKNCDKLRIDSNIEGAPTIVLDKVHLYYDAEILDRAPTIRNMTLWYERYSVTDPNLQVSGMTVTLLGKFETVENIDPWDSDYANDNHYAYALRSLTFGNDGSIINVGLLVGDSTTANIDEGKSVFAAPFILPQSVGIGYPVTKMTHRIKVTGDFVSHYYIANENEYMMKSTQFTALTQKYNAITQSNEVGGTISFYTDAQIVSHIDGVPAGTTVDGWDLNTPHFFEGGVIE